MNVALVPMWLLSGALFPASGASPWVRTLMRFNPLTPAVEILRAVLTNTPTANLASAAGAVAAFALVTLSIATLLVSRPSR
jgi:ABC-2 type transport system permease protein